MTSRGPILLRLGALALGRAACKKSGRAPDGAKGPALATVGDRVITAADLQAKIAEQPAFSQARYKSPEKRKELLDTVIRSELLLAEARRRGLADDPEVK